MQCTKAKRITENLLQRFQTKVVQVLPNALQTVVGILIHRFIVVTRGWIFPGNQKHCLVIVEQQSRSIADFRTPQYDTFLKHLWRKMSFTSCLAFQTRCIRSEQWLTPTRRKNGSSLRRTIHEAQWQQPPSADSYIIHVQSLNEFNWLSHCFFFLFLRADELMKAFARKLHTSLIAKENEHTHTKTTMTNEEETVTVIKVTTR